MEGSASGDDATRKIASAERAWSGSIVGMMVSRAIDLAQHIGL